MVQYTSQRFSGISTLTQHVRNKVISDRVTGCHVYIFWTSGNCLRPLRDLKGVQVLILVI